MSPGAGASSPPVVVVGKSAIEVLGVTLDTTEALIALLSAKSLTLVRLRHETDAGYERIGKVIYGLARAGIEVDGSDFAAQQA